MKRQLGIFLRLLITGFAIVLVWFGMMGFAFHDKTGSGGIPAYLVWLIPLLGFPVAVMIWVYDDAPPITAWLILAAQWAAFDALNWISEVKGDSFHVNPFVLLLSGAVAFPVWLWIGVSVVWQYYSYRRAHGE